MPLMEPISSIDFPDGAGARTEPTTIKEQEIAMTTSMTDDASNQVTGFAEPRWFLGTAIRILVSASDANDDLCVVEHRMPRGEAPPLHVHRNEDEVFVLLDGRLRMQIGDRRIHLEKGQAAVAPKGLPHALVVESETAHVLTITKGHDFETMLRSMSRPATDSGLPPPLAPTPEMVAALTDACRQHNIDLVGPPIA
jgi:mannose-6-phosphate isomerase-like protein (cupin superfamily)